MTEKQDWHDGFSHRKPKWPLAGYAPGGYMNTCSVCNLMMINVDKRALHCFPCAVDVANNSLDQYRARVRELEAQVDTLKAAIQIVQGDVR